MPDSVLKSGLDTFLIAVPFVGVLFIGIFRLDAIIAAPKQAVGLRCRPSVVDKRGLSDPDGRPWKDV